MVVFITQMSSFTMDGINKILIITGIFLLIVLSGCNVDPSNTVDECEIKSSFRDTIFRYQTFLCADSGLTTGRYTVLSLTGDTMFHVNIVEGSGNGRFYDSVGTLVSMGKYRFDTHLGVLGIDSIPGEVQYYQTVTFNN